ncbi:MAG: hypothetical protein IJK26_09415 [Clostridia bacterium]|nr:hypothetical protein [Clostridia bacterium]
MFRFNEVEPTKAIENATNLTALSDRAVVCKVKKPFIVNKDNNRIMYEKDDVVVVRGYDEGVKVISKEDVIDMSSETTIDAMYSWRDDDEQEVSGFARLMQYADEKKMSLSEFRDTFEVDDNETAVLEKYLNTAESNLSDYLEYEKRLDTITNKINASNDVWNVVSALVSGTFCVASIIITILKASVEYWYISLFFGVLAAIFFLLCAFYMVAYDTGECFLPKPIATLANSNRKKEYAKIKKEYESNRASDTNALNAFRRDTGWYAGE